MDRRNYDDNIAAQWRSWANSKVNYTPDFPAPLLTGTELSDNSLANGATRFDMIFDITNPRAAKFICRDNAGGIKDQRSLLRFLKIGSKDSVGPYNQYGQGRICALTTFMPIYESAEWTATFKHCGNPESLSQISHPWRSSDDMQSSMIQIPIDATNRDIGFEWDITFDASVLGEELATDPQKMFAKTKERLTTKYGKAIFEKTEFVLTVKGATYNRTESSLANKWKPFKEMVKELPPSCCEVVFAETFQWLSIPVRVEAYHLKSFPKKMEPAELVALRTAFPTFGTRCENSQRVHISNDHRLIESRPKPEMEHRRHDNHQNGEFVFVDSDSTCDGGDFNDLPTPSTIKVSIVDDCKNLSGIYQMYREKKRVAEDAKLKAAKEKSDKEAIEKIAAREAAAAAAAAARAASLGGGAVAGGGAGGAVAGGGGNVSSVSSVSVSTQKIQKQNEQGCDASHALALALALAPLAPAPSSVDKIAELRKINTDLRRESEGKTTTNRKLQEKIDNLEGEDPVAQYVEEIKRLKELNQELRRMCIVKDKTNQKLKAKIIRLGGNAPAEDE